MQTKKMPAESENSAKLEAESALRSTTCSPRFVADERIKAFCLRNGFAIPTDKELESFPGQFRTFNKKSEIARITAGIALWQFCTTGQIPTSDF